MRNDKIRQFTCMLQEYIWNTKYSLYILVNMSVFMQIMNLTKHRCRSKIISVLQMKMKIFSKHKAFSQKSGKIKIYLGLAIAATHAFESLLRPSFR